MKIKRKILGQSIAVLLAAASGVLVTWAINECIENVSIGAWQCDPTHPPTLLSAGTLNGATTINICQGQTLAGLLPTIGTSPTFNNGKKRRFLDYHCQGDVWQTSDVVYQAGALSFAPQSGAPAIDGTFNTPGQYTYAVQVSAAPISLMGWWHGQDNGNDVVLAHTVQALGNATYDTAGEVGKAFKFDGLGDGFRVIGTPLEFQLQDFTVEAWIKRANATEATLNGTTAVIVGYGSGGYAFGLTDDGKLFLTRVDVSNVMLTGHNIADLDVWHHVAVTKTGSTVKFYIDGTGYTVAAYNPGFTFFSQIAIGARGDNLGGSFLGSIDEPAIYDCALTDQQIAAIYSAGSSGKCWPPTTTCVLPANCVCSPVGGFSMSQTVTINVSGSCPSIGLPTGDISYTVGAAPKTVDAAATISSGGGSFNSSVLTVSLPVNAQTDDALIVNNEGTGSTQINVTGSTIKYGTTTIGTFTGGTGTTPLAITFAASGVNQTMAQALIRNIRYRYYPTGSQSQLTRTVKFVLTVLVGGLNYGSIPATRQITVACPNSIETVLIIDKSGSMEPAGNPQSENRLATAKTAAANFLNYLQFTSDKAGVIAFCGTAERKTTSPNLATSQATATTAINNITTTCGDTLYAQPLSFALSDLGTPRAGVLRLIIHLTDGELSPNTQANLDAALAQATTARNTEVRLVTIGLGSTIGGTDSTALAAQDILRRMASSPADFYLVGNSISQLDAKYAAIANSACRGSQPPAISLLPTPLAYTENGGTVVMAPSTTLSDPDSPNFDTGTLTISIPTGGQAADVLGIRNEAAGVGKIHVSGQTPGSTVSYEFTAGTSTTIGTIGTGSGTPVSLVIVFNASANVASVQALLRNVTFANALDNPLATARTVNAVMTDGDGGTSPTAVMTINVTPVNDKPVIQFTPSPLNYTENAAATPLAASSTVTDIDSADFNTGSLTVDFTANGEAADQLGIRNEAAGVGKIHVSGQTPGSTVSYEFTAGTSTQIGTIGTGSGTPVSLVVNLNASATPAAAQALLRNVTYRSVSENPSALPRTVRAVLNDGDGDNSLPTTMTVNVTPVNDAPTLTHVGIVGSVMEDHSVTVTHAMLAGAGDEADVDSSPVYFRYSGGVSGTLTQNGTPVPINGVLGPATAPWVWTPPPNVNGMNHNAFLVEAWDGLLPSIGEGVVSFDINPVNDAPDVSLGDPVTFTVGDPPLVIAPAAIVEDTDVMLNEQAYDATITITMVQNANALDRLSIQNNPADQVEIIGDEIHWHNYIVGVVEGDSSAGIAGQPLKLLVYGGLLDPAQTVQMWQDLIRNIVFQNTAANPSRADRTVRVTIKEIDSPTSSPADKIIHILPRNQRPVVHAGPDRYIGRDNGVQAHLTGSVTDDGLPTGSLSVSWYADYGNPPAIVNFSSDPAYPYDEAKIIATFHPAPGQGTKVMPGIYKFFLYATDGSSGGDVQDEMTVTVMSSGSRTYTRNVDFEQGSMLNVNYDALPNQLQLNKRTTPYPYVNVSATSRGTVVRIDANNGNVVGEYLSAPNDGQPSRTTVDLFGNAWVGSRNNSVTSVARVGLVIGGTRGDKVPDNGTTPFAFVPNAKGKYLSPPFVYSTCKDKDGDGLIFTSGGLGDIRLWSPDQYERGALRNTDEALDFYPLAQTTTAVRTMAIDKNNNLWAGSPSGSYEYLNVSSGVPQVKLTLGAGVGAYGGLVDRNGVLWSVGTYGNDKLVRYDPAAVPAVPLVFNAAAIYGIGIDPVTGNIWHSTYGGSGNAVVLNKNGLKLGAYSQGSTTGRGIAVDTDHNVWVALTADGIGHLRTDGTFVGTISLPCATDTTGVAVDSNGKIWATDRSGKVYRINPDGGPNGGGNYKLGYVDLVLDLDNGREKFTPPYNGMLSSPYNYSDMTGFVSLGATAASGAWDIIHDPGEDVQLGWQVTWTSEEVPAQGATLRVEARTADSIPELASKPFYVMLNGGGSGSYVPGSGSRYVEARITFFRGQTSDGSFVTPVLKDLTFTTGLPTTPITTAENSRRIAHDDDFTVTENIGDNIDNALDVRENDDKSLGNLTITSVSSAHYGAVTTDGQKVHYTPNLGFSGADRFTYTVTDGSGAVDHGLVVVKTLRNNPLVTPPHAANDAFTIYGTVNGKTGPKTFDVLANDDSFQPTDGDRDRDGVPDYIEKRIHTVPFAAADVDNFGYGDGIADNWEKLIVFYAQHDSNPNNDAMTIENVNSGTDFDGDTIPDDIEFQRRTSATGNADSDNDRVPDLIEWLIGTNPSTLPANLDTDSDGLSDDFERWIIYAAQHDHNLLNDGITSLALVLPGDDFDDDGVSNADEYAAHTSPVGETDDDGDHVPDYLTSRLITDTNGDGLPEDWVAWIRYVATVPLTDIRPGDDLDHDGQINSVEYANGTMPVTLEDRDGDKVPDYFEVYFGTNPSSAADNDHDGMPDDWEYWAYWASMGAINSDLDPTGDLDGDQVSNLNEYLNGTSPVVIDDTDGDKVPDYIENWILGTSITSTADTDTDGLSDEWEAWIKVIAQDPPDNILPGGDYDGDGETNLSEYQKGHLPFSTVDSDNDGVPDYIERTQGTDPFVNSPADLTAWIDSRRTVDVGTSMITLGSPRHGTVEMVSVTGSTKWDCYKKVRYTPTPGFAGTDSFTYTIVNSKGMADSATVIVTVLAPPTVTCGQTKNGQLSAADANMAYDNWPAANLPRWQAYVDNYEFLAEDSQTITIHMHAVSAAFVPQIILRDPAGVAQELAADGSGNIDFNFTVDSSTEGTYTIEATSLEGPPLPTGSYQLSVTCTLPKGILEASYGTKILPANSLWVWGYFTIGGAEVERELTLKNLGGQDITITSLTPDGAAFTLGTPSDTTIPGNGGSVTLPVTYTIPSPQDFYDGGVTIEYSDGISSGLDYFVGFTAISRNPGYALMTSPATGSEYKQSNIPYPIWLEAFVEPPIGLTVTKVQFWDTTTDQQLGSDVTSPTPTGSQLYGTAITAFSLVGVGNHSVKAIVTFSDTSGTETFPITLRVLPSSSMTVDIISPATGSIFPPPAGFDLKAYAKSQRPHVGGIDANLIVESVKFNRVSGGSPGLIDTVLTHTYGASWSGLAAGKYKLSVSGDVISEPVTIFIGTAVNMTAPVNQSTLPSGQMIHLEAKIALGTGQAASNVKFYKVAGTPVLLGTATPLGAGLYSYDWSGMAAGKHQVFARVDLGGGVLVDSDPVTVYSGSGVKLELNAGDMLFEANAIVPFQMAAAADTAQGWTFHHMELIDADTGDPINNNITTSPFTAEWNPGAGRHVAKAKAIFKKVGFSDLIVESDTVPVFVAGSDFMRMTAPADGTRFDVGASVPMTAIAVPGDGELAPDRVFFMNGTPAQPIGPVEDSGLFTLHISEPLVGIYQYNATATYRLVSDPTLFWVVDSAPITVYVARVPIDNDLPIALNDSYTVWGNERNKEMVVTVNDSDPNNDDFHIIGLASPPRNGSVWIDPDGKRLYYTPTVKEFADDYGGPFFTTEDEECICVEEMELDIAALFGPDSFVYVIEDTKGGRAEAVVDLNIVYFQPPIITITDINGADPAAGPVTILFNQQSFPVEINTGVASGSLQSIARVELYLDGAKVAEALAPDGGVATFVISRILSGKHSVRAKAIDTSGAVNYSKPAVVIKDKKPGNNLPTAIITSPAETPRSGPILPDPAAQTVTPLIEGYAVPQGTATDVDPVATDTIYYQFVLRKFDGELLGQLCPPIQRRIASGNFLDGAGNPLKLDFTRFPEGMYLLELQVWDNWEMSTASVPIKLRNQLKIGQFTFTQEDMVISDGGLPLSVARTYDSLNLRSGDFGYGWTYVLNDMNIELNEDRRVTDDLLEDEPFSMRVGGGRDVTLTLPDGRRTTFIYNMRQVSYSGGEANLPAYEAYWDAEPGVTATLTTLHPGTPRHNGEDGSPGDNSLLLLPAFPSPFWAQADYKLGVENYDFPGYKLKLEDGTVYEITREDLEERVVVEDGHAMYPHAYGEPKLSRIIMPDGTIITINGDKIVKTSPTGVEMSAIVFLRDRAGRIGALYDPAGLDSNGNPAGYEAMRYSYDAKGNLSTVSKLTDRSTGAYETMIFEYSSDPAFPHYLVGVVDSRGIPISHTEYYNDSGDAANYGKIKSVTDAKGRTTSYVHKTTGFATGRPTGYGTPVVREEITLTPVVGLPGQTTIFESDTRGNVLYSEDAFGFKMWSKFGPRAGLDPADPEADTWLVQERQYTVTEQQNGSSVTRTYFRSWNYEGPATLETPVAQKLAPTSMTDLHVAGTLAAKLRITRNVNNALGLPTKIFDPKNSSGSTVYRETQYDENPESSTYGLMLRQLFHGADPVTPAEGQKLSETVYYPGTHTFRGKVSHLLDAENTATVYEYYGSGDGGGRFGSVKSVTIRANGPTGTPLSKVAFTYDQNGNRLTEEKVKFQRDGSGAVLVDGNGTPLESGRLITQSEYDGKGRVTKVTDPSGATSETTYDSTGKMSTTTDRYNVSTTYYYDRTGNLSGTRYPDGNLSYRATYYEDGGSEGILRCEVSEDRHPADATSITGSRSVYNAAGRAIRTEKVKNLVIILDVHGEIQDTSYDTGHPCTVLTRTMSQHYADGRLAKTVADLDLSATISSGDEVTAYEYDADGLGKTTILPDVQDGSDTIHSKTVETTDLNGNTITVQTLSYRNSNTTPETQRPVTGFVYDQLNRRKEIWSYANETLSGAVRTDLSQYDWMNRAWLRVDPDNHAQVSVYGTGGQLSWVITDVYTSPQPPASLPGVLPTTRDGWVTWARGTRGSSDSTATHYEYNELGQETKQIDANNHVTIFIYDDLGRRKERYLPMHTEASPMVERWFYDFAEAGDTPATGKRINKVRHVDFNNQQVYLVFDLLGRLVQKKSSSSVLTEYDYSISGRRTRMRDNLNSGSPRSTRYVYDEQNRLRIKDTPEGTLTYEYNTAGDLKTISSRKTYTIPTAPPYSFGTIDPTGTQSNPSGAYMAYTYDLGRRLLKVNPDNPDGTGNADATYGYDLLGNQSKMTYRNGVDTSYAYNSRNVLRRVRSTLSGALVANFDYDEAGQAVTPNTSTFTWGSRLLSSTGRRNRLLEIINGSTSVNRQIDYDYDNLNRLTRETLGGSSPNLGTITYDATTGYGDSAGYDPVGNRFSRTVSLTPAISGYGTMNYSAYDGNDRLGQIQSPKVGATFDANGNTLQYDLNADGTADVGTPDQYNLENRLVTATRGVGVVTMVYDGDGNRVSKTVSGTTTQYLVDTHNLTGHAQVLQERTSPTGAPTVTYVYGQDLISQTRGGTKSYYGYDGLGSVRYLTDSSGVVSDTYTYDAFGIKISGSGSTANNYLYTGEQYDSDLGLYYLRTRYYKPELGRFWTMDTFEGQQQDPLSLHKYLYTHDNPVNNTDPSGQYNVAEQLLVTGIITILAASYITYQVLSSAASDNFQIDGAFLSLGLNTGYGGLMFGVNAMFILDKNGGLWFLWGIEAGFSPMTATRKAGNTIGKSFVVGACFNMQEPDDFSGLGFTATWPLMGFASRVLISRFARSFISSVDAQKWYAIVANASKQEGTTVNSTNPNYNARGCVQFGLSSSGSSYIGIGFRDNSFSATVSVSSHAKHLFNVATGVINLLQKIQGKDANLGSMFDEVDSWDFTDLVDSIPSLGAPEEDDDSF